MESAPSCAVWRGLSCPALRVNVPGFQLYLGSNRPLVPNILRILQDWANRSRLEGSDSYLRDVLRKKRLGGCRNQACHKPLPLPRCFDIQEGGVPGLARGAQAGSDSADMFHPVLGRDDFADFTSEFLVNDDHFALGHQLAIDHQIELVTNQPV